MRKAGSKEILMQTLHDMMCSTPFEQITVTDILNESGVSRTTFYRHFYGKTDLLISLFEDKIAMNNFFIFYAPSYEREQDFFRFLYQDREFWLHAFTVPDLVNKWRTLAQKSLLMEYRSCFSNEEDAFFFSVALSAAYVQMNRTYLNSSRNHTPEEISAYMQKFTLGALKAFHADPVQAADIQK